MAEHLSIPVALDRNGTVDPDVAPAVVVDRLLLANPLRLHEDEGDLALLVLKANVHALLIPSLPNRAFDLLVALHQAFNLDLLLDHALQRLHLGLDSLAHGQQLRLLLFMLIHELGFIWCHVFLDSELIVIFVLFLAVGVF